MEYFSTSFLLISLICFTIAQQGKDCNKDADCYPHQTCNFGYCRCDRGYVKNIHHCFKLRKYGQDCEFEEQCNDFRMTCQPRPNETVKRCLCGSLHEWNNELTQCVPVGNFAEIIGSLEEDTSWSDHLHDQGAAVFYNIAAAGIFVASSLLIITLVGITYGCCFKGRDGVAKKKDEENVTIQEVAGEGTGGTYIPVATDLTTERGS